MFRPNHLAKCETKLHILMEQKMDMHMAFDQLIDDIRNGDRKMKVYRQMKMYNDASLNLCFTRRNNL